MIPAHLYSAYQVIDCARNHHSEGDLAIVRGISRIQRPIPETKANLTLNGGLEIGPKLSLLLGDHLDWP
ncbi:MAG: hypothetical protein WB116_06765 [Candidatus Dormiibacterota bacterium]